MAYTINENEKTNPINNISFKWKQTLEMMLVLLNLFASFWVFSHSSWFPITLEAFRFCYSKLMLLLNNSFFTFLLLNAILLSLYAFSSFKNDAVSTSNDLYDEYLNHSIGMTEQDFKPITCSDEKVTCSDETVIMGAETVTTAVTETTTTTTTCCTTVRSAKRTAKESGDEVSEKKCYRRTQSDSVERRRMVAEFKRYNTGLSLSREGKSSCHVEELSKDEFNRAVEDFIAKQKRMLLEEQRKTEILDFSR